MNDLRNEPILTDSFEAAADFKPEKGSLYVYMASAENRSQHVELWAKNTDVALCRIESIAENSFTVERIGSAFSLRSPNGISELWTRFPHKGKTYIDITGLPHAVWASVIRSAINCRLDVAVVYVEPNRYTRSMAPVEGQIYDLSEQITGIAPLPGFVRFSERPTEDSLFIPLLGFEGARLSYLIEQVQPNNDRIIPIIGCPGFKPHYVFESYLGNKRPLLETSAWHAARYAPASCPFSCYYLLQRIAEENVGKAMKIALIGTKPHALGAVLFCLATIGRNSELVYDHPIRKVGRTDGTDRLHVYHISPLVEEVGDLSQRHLH